MTEASINHYITKLTSIYPVKITFRVNEPNTSMYIISSAF